MTTTKIRQMKKSVLGWRVTATPVVCGLYVYWIGVFDGQQIPTKFVSPDAIFAHVLNCLECNRHPCRVKFNVGLIEGEGS
jgi:hypothetical protein